MAGDRTAIVAGGEGRNTPAAAHVASLALAGRASVASSLHRAARLATGSEHADGGGSDRVIPEARHAGMSNPAVSTPATSSPSESRYHTAEPARRSGSPTPSRSEARRPSCRNNSERGKAYRRWTSASIATREAPSGPMVYARAGAWIQNSSSRLSPTRFFASIPVEPDRAGLVVARDHGRAPRRTYPRTGLQRPRDPRSRRTRRGSRLSEGCGRHRESQRPRPQDCREHLWFRGLIIEPASKEMLNVETGACPAS